MHTQAYAYTFKTLLFENYYTAWPFCEMLLSEMQSGTHTHTHTLAYGTNRFGSWFFLISRARHTILITFIVLCVFTHTHTEYVIDTWIFIAVEDFRLIPFLADSLIEIYHHILWKSSVCLCVCVWCTCAPFVERYWCREHQVFEFMCATLHIFELIAKKQTAKTKTAAAASAAAKRKRNKCEHKWTFWIARQPKVAKSDNSVKAAVAVQKTVLKCVCARARPTHNFAN